MSGKIPDSNESTAFSPLLATDACDYSALHRRPYARMDTLTVL